MNTTIKTTKKHTKKIFQKLIVNKSLHPTLKNRGVIEPKSLANKEKNQGSNPCLSAKAKTLAITEKSSICKGFLYFFGIQKRAKKSKKMQKKGVKMGVKV